MELQLSKMNQSMTEMQQKMLEMQQKSSMMQQKYEETHKNIPSCNRETGVMLKKSKVDTVMKRLL